jgi:hypothetical protein
MPTTAAKRVSTVRWSAAQRLPPRYLREMRGDLHREVRIRVAARIEGVAWLPGAISHNLDPRA